jgi:hypothetical protein
MEITQALINYIWQLIGQAIGSVLPLFFGVVVIAVVVGMFAYDLLRSVLRVIIEAIENSDWHLKREIKLIKHLLDKKGVKLNREQRLKMLVHLEELEYKLSERSNPGIVL